GVALLDDQHRLGAADLRDTGLAGDLHVGHRAGAVHRAEDRERAVVDRATDDRDGGRRVRLGVHHEGLEPPALNAALLVELLDRQEDAVAPHVAGGRAAAGDLGDDRELHDVLGWYWGRGRRAGRGSAAAAPAGHLGDDRGLHDVLG